MASSPVRVSGPINAAGLEMTLETGKLAPQANGAVLVRVGDTTILSTVVTSKPREGIDFFPLTVDVEERMYAAGKIPGGVFRREGRPGEPAILTCRLTDRPLRPSFPEGFRNEVQVVATVMGADLVNPHDVASINGASAALTVSGIPFDGPIGAVRLSRQGSEWIAHPTFEQSAESTFELVVAGRMIDGGDIAIMMVEAGGTEATWRLYEEGAPKVDEEVIAGGLEEAKQWIAASINLQKDLRTAVIAERGPIADIAYEIHSDYDDDVFETVAEQATTSTSEAMAIADKTERNNRLDEILEGLLLAMCGTPEEPEPFASRAKQIKPAFRSLQKKVVRSRIVNEGLRIDGRTTTQIRPLSAEVEILPTAHGSGLFQRGETQVLSVLTLGMPRMEQFIGLDELRGTTKRYIHHYNFPPYSTGETGRVGSPKRREIGHGALAERALLPVVPSQEEWPYVVRIVSDVLSSNGSTSMASVCGSTLSMLDGGVPLKAPVAGIAMGLVYAEGKYTTLTDILGTEDAFGDMDFKVAGTRDFVTALQLDTKIDGLPAEVLAQALLQARDARMQILDVMEAAIAGPRDDVRETAPKIVSFEIPMDKIGEVIGPKGKVINTITQETGADVSVSDDGVVGTVSIGSKDGAAVEEARRRIELILDPPTAELGAEYTGKVVNVTKFGAFVNILPGRDGLLHISKIGRGKRVERVEDVLNLGDEVTVRVDDIDNSGKLSLSLAGDDSGSGDDGGSGGGERAPRERSERPERSERSDRPERSGGNGSGNGAASGAEVASFEDSWDSQVREEFGDLGPAEAGRSADRPGAGSGAGVVVVVVGPGAGASTSHDGGAGLLRRTRLDSGLRVVTERLPGLRSVAVGFWVGTGSRDEAAPVAGASHFLEHLLFKGTATRQAAEIAEAVESVGGDMNAFTGQEVTAYYVRVPDRHLGLALDILSDIVWSPALRAEEVESERQVILEEIRMRDDQPDDLVHEAFANALFNGHPLGREVAGSFDTIGAMARDAIATYHGEHYVPSNIVVAAAGNLDHDDVVAQVERALPRAAGIRPPRANGVAAATQLPVALLERPLEQAHLVLGMRALPRDDPDRYALAVLDQVLGGGMSSRLFQEVRERRGLAYSVFSYRSAYEDTGAFAVYCGTAPEHVEEVLALLRGELERVVTDGGITERELENAKGHLAGSMALSLESSSSRMHRIGRAELTLGEIPTIDEVVAQVEAISADDVARVVERVLGPGGRTLAAVGPIGTLDLGEPA